MKKIVLVTSLFLLSSAALFSQGKVSITPSQKIICIEVPVSGYFDAIQITGIPDVEYRISSDGSSSATITGPDNVVEYIEVKESQNTLEVKSYEKLTLEKNAKVLVRVTGPAVRKLSVHGRSNVQFPDPLRGEYIEMDVNGVGALNLAGLECNRAEISANGVAHIEIDNCAINNLSVFSHGIGNVKLEGKADNAHYELHGMGNIKAGRLIAKDLVAHVSGMGNINCHATSSLSMKESGMGKIKYSGNPTLTNPTRAKKKKR